MKYKTVSTIAAILCGTLLAFVPAFAQENTMTAQSGDTFPKTAEEINLVRDLIVSARYDVLIEVCVGKNLDFSKIELLNGHEMPLLYLAIVSSEYEEDVFKRMNKIFEFLLKNGGLALIPTKWGEACAYKAADANNKVIFDLLLKNGYDLNQKDSNGKTVLDYILKDNSTVDP